MTIRMMLLAGAAALSFMTPAHAQPAASDAKPATAAAAAKPEAAKAEAEAAKAPAATPASIAPRKKRPMMGDADNNGMLSRDEFMSMQEARFKEMDGNADGNVTPQEKTAFDAKMRAARKAGKPDAAGDTAGEKPSFLQRFFN